MASGFIGGDHDTVVRGTQAQIDAMPSLLPDYRGTWMLEGPGHWTRKRTRPASTPALLEFLRGLSSRASAQVVRADALEEIDEGRPRRAARGTQSPCRP